MAESNRPLRVFEKVLNGGLGAGNIGVVCARHGTGKQALLTLIAIDKAMEEKNVLLVALGTSVSNVRAYRDEVLSELETSLDISDRAAVLTRVERHSRIHSYRDAFSLDRLRQTLIFAKEHAEFTPSLVEMEGWPDFSKVTREDMSSLKALATEFGFEVWLTAHTENTSQRDAQGIPTILSPVEDLISVILTMEPEDTTVPLKFVRVHGKPATAGIHLDFDPKTHLLRWR